MDADLNRYDIHHVTTTHPLMSREQWAQAYEQSWSNYYTDEHVETVLRRCVATGTSPGKTMMYLVWFSGGAQIEKVHPIESGYVRLKFRRDRRSSLLRESALTFYPKYLAETVRKQIQLASLYLRYYRILKKVTSDPRMSEYTDLAITPVTDDELETRELFQSAEAQAYLVKIRGAEEARRSVAVR
jgi:hypothetical protein